MGGAFDASAGTESGRVAPFAQEEAKRFAH